MPLLHVGINPSNTTVQDISAVEAQQFANGYIGAVQQQQQFGFPGGTFGYQLNRYLRAYKFDVIISRAWFLNYE